ncbi:MAG: hypothetical protein CMM60_12465 [Rhodospirillaceae bacterium]|jgi:hypothetical protein|nr:hypothetical protein [Rhodospirillaceae bacterium]|tara:strand:+ start:1147 stop:1827 length:681 start_codon:yes stop_codon:yes gene_type:complete
MDTLSDIIGGGRVWPALSALPLLLSAGLIGLLIRTALSQVGQTWAATYHHTMTYILLPVTAFIITRVIADNISLSLGMIGALSIVRFRNPVRNPFELVVFFALVTTGIAVSAEPSLGILLGLFFVLTVYSVYGYEKYCIRMDRQPFALSFSEGDLFNTIHIRSRGRIPDLDSSPALTSRLDDITGNECTYLLTLRTRREVDSIEGLLSRYRPQILSMDTRMGQPPT